MIKKIIPSRLKGGNGGYTLLFAMIVASVVLVIGVSLLNVSRKEFDLASSATQSSSAFYAADSGLDCAEYWATYSNAFATSSPSPTAFSCSYADASGAVTRTVTECPTAGSPPCGTLPTYPNEVGPTYELSFSTPFSDDGTGNQSCAYVTFDQYYATNPSTHATSLYNTITARGYNIGWNPTTKDCSIPSPKKVERALQLTYQD